MTAICRTKESVLKTLPKSLEPQIPNPHVICGQGCILFIILPLVIHIAAHARMSSLKTAFTTPHAH